MIEVYVIATLLGLGYIINKNKSEEIVTSSEKLMDKKSLPSGNNAYDSRRLNVVDNIQKQAAASAYGKSLEDKSAVINRMKDVFVKSRLTDTVIPQKEFVHNNMTPFYRGSLKQNMNVDSSRHILESFGTLYDTEIVKKKKEVSQLFEPTRDVTNPTGMKAQTDFMQSRYENSRIQNNTLPFEQVRVGPGLNQGYDGGPTGGFQQLELQNIVRPKTVDELRILSKPKETYAGRIVDGIREKKLGKIGELNKNRVSTYFEQGPERYMKTTGAFLKETLHPKYEAKPTTRMDTSKEYKGTAFGNKAETSRPEVRDPLRSQLQSFDISHPNLGSTGLGSKDDYGKGNILVYANERDITSTKTYQGNISSIVKAFVAPLQDIIKPSKKEFSVENPRHFGQMSLQIPNKQPIRDPNDVMRTTIKETNVHDAELLNVKGPVKVSVYDPNDITRATLKETMIDNDTLLNLKGSAFKLRVHPNDIARTTIKETTVHDSDKLNVRPKVYKGEVYDPNDIAKTTLKETLLHDADHTNIAVRDKRGIAYDPNDIAKTTLKETLLHDADYTNIAVQDKRGIAYDPNIKAKSTIRQTLSSIESTLNMKSTVRKGTVHDPADVAKTTIKETMIDDLRKANITSLAGQRTAYQSEAYDMKETQKETYADNDYYGGARTGTGEGYLVANVEAKTTQKQFTSENEYFGGLADRTHFKSKSYEDMYNACIDDLKEATLVSREPTQTSVKVASGSERVNMDIKKLECDDLTERDTMNKTRVVNNFALTEDSSITRMPQDYGDDDRLDVDILKAFKENPYTKSLNSFA